MTKRWFVPVVLAIGVGVSATLHAADDAFSKAVRPEDFSAAGLAKLSPEELARLDALVRDFKTGKLSAANDDLALKLAAAKRETEVADQARIAAEAKAAKAEAAKADAEAKAQSEATVAAAKEKEREKEKKAESAAGGPSLLARAKVLLTPGTEIEYTTVESRIAGNFTGWEGKPIFTLENGSRWQITNGGSYNTPPIASPKVKIVPSTLGGFWMTIEGVSQRVRVTPLSVGK